MGGNLTWWNIKYIEVKYNLTLLHVFLKCGLLNHMENKSVVHGFDGKAAVPAANSPRLKTQGTSMKKGAFLLFAVVVVLGLITGGVVYAVQKPNVVTVTENTDVSKLPAGTVFGSDDEKLFPNDAEGVLKTGGVNGEGTHHLERPGGESQNVYLTSSVIDLAELEGRKIKVWGKTYEAQTAGWFMDVGRAQIIK